MLNQGIYVPGLGRAARRALYEVAAPVAFGVWDAPPRDVFAVPVPPRMCRNGCPTRLRATNPKDICSVCERRETERFLFEEKLKADAEDRKRRDLRYRERVQRKRKVQ